jgi:hypothetical protein
MLIRNSLRGLRCNGLLCSAIGNKIIYTTGYISKKPDDLVALVEGDATLVDFSECLGAYKEDIPSPAANVRAVCVIDFSPITKLIAILIYPVKFLVLQINCIHPKRWQGM